MFDLIVVPLDGSRLSERALSLAVPLAEQHGASLALLHAHAPVLPLPLGGGAPARDPALELAAREEQSKYVTRLAKRIAKQSGLTVAPVLAEGAAAEAIVERAGTGRNALIVMSTHGRGGFKRFWLGSVADRVTRLAHVPVLLLTGNRSTGKRLAGTPLFRHVLVSLDGSPRAEGALRAAERLVSGAPASITLAHVVHPMTAVAAQAAARDPAREVIEGYLEPLIARHRREGLRLDHEVTVDGDVTGALLAMAARHEAGAIAITSQGLGGVQRFVVGSVADKLIRTSPVPVLVCPGATAL